MTGLAPISNETAAAANFAVTANTGATPAAQSADVQRSADFSSVLNASTNAAQTTPAETPGRNVVVGQGNSSHGQKTPSSQTNQQAAAPAFAISLPVVLPTQISSALASCAPAPLPPPLPTATSAPLNAASAESGVSAAENVASAEQAITGSTVPAQPVISEGAPGNKSDIAAPSAVTLRANDSTAPQTGAAMAEPSNAAVGGAGDPCTVQPAADANQNAASQAGAEIAATISSAMADAASGNRSLVDPAQADHAAATAAPAAADRTIPTANAAAPQETAPELLPPQTALPSEVPPAPKQNSNQLVPAATTSTPATRNSQNSRTVSQPVAPETVSTNAAAAIVGLQKAISDARDKLIEAFGARLQAEISAAPTTAASGAEAANGGSGNLPRQTPENASINSGARNIVNPSADVATGIAADSSGSSSGAQGPSANSPSSAMEKVAALVAAAMNPTVHAPSTGSQQAASTILSQNNSQPAGPSNASAARPETPALPSPPLPQSLGDMAKAGQLYQRVGGSEMHIAMETDLLGAVDLRATMHQSALTATIGVQRADVQALLSNDLPALQHALADKNFHVQQISVLNNSVGGRASSSEQQEAPARNPFAPRGGYAANVAGTGASNREDLRAGAGASSIAYGWNDDGGRISVHV